MRPDGLKPSDKLSVATAAAAAATGLDKNLKCEHHRILFTVNASYSMHNFNCSNEMSVVVSIRNV